MGKLTGERRAVAAAVLGFYMSIFFLTSLQAPAGWGRVFGALAGVYGVGFVGLVAGYFWARWFTIGLGLYGLIGAALSIWQIGPEPVLVFYGATHALASLVLWGDRMALPFDGRADWRSKYHLDENATHRLGKSIIRVGVMLPMIVMYALAPREGGMGLELVGLALLGAGAWGLMRMRSWGLLALGAGGVATLAGLSGDSDFTATVNGDQMMGLGLAAALLAIAAITPFAGPIARYVTRRSR